MTNYEPLKKSIWDAVKSDNKDEFNKQCEALKEKAVGEWWRIGWNLAPKDINEIIEMCENLAKSANEAWIEAMKCGDAPNEDVSPGEGFQHCAEILKKCKNLEGNKNEEQKV